MAFILLLLPADFKVGFFWSSFLFSAVGAKQAFAFAVAAGGDKPIAVMLVGSRPARHPTEKRNAAIAKPKKVGAHIKKPRTGDATRKIHPIKKTWMMHLPHPGYAGIKWRREGKMAQRMCFLGKVIVIFVVVLGSS